MRSGVRRISLLLLLLSSFFSPHSRAQDLASFEKRIQVKKLPNGLTIILCERHEAPVFSFFTLVNAGSAQDPKSKTGLAHMFEHMAFKGTDTIGTTDYAAEKVVLGQIEEAYAAYIAERDKPFGRDEKKLADLEKRWKQLVEDAEKYVVRNQFGTFVEDNGGVGMNAQTAEDETIYFYSMPVNRLERWAFLESSRFAQPVMREFYLERDVVYEERRMSVESRPIGRMIEQFLSAAFMAHPYRNPGIGWPSDVHSFSATDAMNFYDTYYVPSNMVVAVVGDLDPARDWPVIERYFGRLPTRPQPDERTTTEPPQNSERRVVLKETAQPFYVEGYHRPDYLDKDDAVYDAITDLVSNGRTSRLYRALVRDQKIALEAAGFSGLPGTKYPHLFAFYAVPNRGHTPEQVRNAIHAEIERIKKEDISDTELQMFKTRARAALIRSLGSNSGLAQELAIMQTRYGDWRELFRQLDRIDKVTQADIRRVANATFSDTNRTIAIIETVQPAGKAASQPSGGQ
ncbi:MAG TPA: pitrilysin family protein [Terriglobales bacterium]|nr:pitrilysin family protein [Terriglobales bacterium]